MKLLRLKADPESGCEFVAAILSERTVEGTYTAPQTCSNEEPMAWTVYAYRTRAARFDLDADDYGALHNQVCMWVSGEDELRTCEHGLHTHTGWFEDFEIIEEED